MGSIILCHKKKAREPFEIARIKRRIYTIEELCYYLCSHLYLIDHTIMNQQLCDWLRQELELGDLADTLKNHLQQNASKEQFVMTILTASAIYSAAELNQMQDILKKFKNQKPVEKQKFKADNLLQNNSVKAAISIYQSILRDEKDDSVDGKFYGKVYGCIGAAYGRLFLYKEAAKMYEAAYQICEQESMLQAYLYACKKYMSNVEYSNLVQKSPLYQKIDKWIEEERQRLEDEVQYLAKEDTLSKWKDHYRKMNAGENR